MKTAKFLGNDWVITLTATLIGVFLALYLNEWMLSSKITKQKNIATDNILKELSSNKIYLDDAIIEHKNLLEIMGFLGRYVDRNGNFIAPVGALNGFKQKHPNILEIRDSTLVKDDTYDYDGEINLDLSYPHFELSTITLKTLKNSGLIANYGYDCLLYLERIDKLTSEVSLKNQELLDYLAGTVDSGEENETVISHLKLLIDYEETLVELYRLGETELEDCN